MAESIIQYNRDLFFPTLKAEPKQDILIPASTSSTTQGLTIIPMGRIGEELNNMDGDTPIFVLGSDGQILLNHFDACCVEATASLYIRPDTNNVVRVSIFLYHSQSSTSWVNPKDIQVGAGEARLSHSGGVVQLTSRLICPVYERDKFYLRARIMDSAGRVVSNRWDVEGQPPHPDSQFQIRLLPII